MNYLLGFGELKIKRGRQENRRPLMDLFNEISTNDFIPKYKPIFAKFYILNSST